MRPELPNQVVPLGVSLKKTGYTPAGSTRQGLKIE